MCFAYFLLNDLNFLDFRALFCFLCLLNVSSLGFLDGRIRLEFLYRTFTFYQSFSCYIFYVFRMHMYIAYVKKIIINRFVHDSTQQDIANFFVYFLLPFSVFVTCNAYYICFTSLQDCLITAMSLHFLKDFLKIINCM